MTTTEHENALSGRPVVFRPYILYGAYWYGSAIFGVMGGVAFPIARLSLRNRTGASP